MMKMIKTVIVGQKVIFCGSKKTMMPSESPQDFFIKGLRVVRPSIAESFSFAGEGHRKRGRFPVELPKSTLMTKIIGILSELNEIGSYFL